MNVGHNVIINHAMLFVKHSFECRQDLRIITSLTVEPCFGDQHCRSAHVYGNITSTCGLDPITRDATSIRNAKQGYILAMLNEAKHLFLQDV